MERQTGFIGPTPGIAGGHGAGADSPDGSRSAVAGFFVAELADEVYDHVPVGGAVLDTDLRLVKRNGACTELRTGHLGGATGFAVPGGGLPELTPDQADVLALLLDRVLAGEVARQAARRVATDGVGTCSDGVPAPTMRNGGSS